MKNRNVAIAAILGNCLELYDYILFGYLANIIAIQFFPSSDPKASLLMTYGIFAAGFFLRPVGAILFGNIGDRFGRKRALEISILLMAIPSFLIGVLPTYGQVGILAPLLLVVMRMFQGVSVGGELVGSYAFLLEHSDESSKGLTSSWSLVGCFSGKLLGTLVICLMTLFFTPMVLENWGWRIPFLIGILFAAGGYLVRKRVSETPVFLKMQAEHSISKSPLREALQENKREIFSSIGVLAIHTSAVYLLFVYFPIYLQTELHLSMSYALTSNMIALVVAMIGFPIAGKLSDTHGRSEMMIIWTSILTLVVYPLFLVISTGSIPLVIVSHAILAFVFAMMHGPFPSYLSELFPAKNRYTATGVAYNVGVGIFGGVSPLIATYLITLTNSSLAPTIWLIFCGLISLTTLLLTRKPKEVFA